MDSTLQGRLDGSERAEERVIATRKRARPLSSSQRWLSPRTLGPAWRAGAATTRGPRRAEIVRRRDRTSTSRTAGMTAPRRGGARDMTGACSTASPQSGGCRHARGQRSGWTSASGVPASRSPAHLAERDPGCRENIRPIRRRRSAGARRERAGVRRPPVRARRDRSPARGLGGGLRSPRERRRRFVSATGTSWRRIREINLLTGPDGRSYKVHDLGDCARSTARDRPFPSVACDDPTLAPGGHGWT
jgi:hypothetical protein